MNKLLNLKKFFIFISLIFFSNILFAQTNHNSILDEESVFFKQDVPILEGVDNFTKRLETIRCEQNREPLGLVLCGGSARAFAHVGALKAMEENQITPDFIVANSMGAIIGLLYAYGFSPDKIAEIISNINLTEFFEPVVPIHGGLISVRKFRALIQSLLGTESADLKNCDIPVLILTEDLYTKRQIWHAEGDLASIMTASFSMSAIMEPIKYSLHDEDQTKVLLTDSGAIDIAGLSVAESFTNNIVISTALYDPVLNFNNPITVLNRTTSIGKERQAISDIKEYNPLIIQNEVEHFSFMAFDKAEELSQIGYECTLSVMDKLKETPHSYKDLSTRRNQTNKYANDTIKKLKSNGNFSQTSNYFGLKLWPVFPVVDFPNYFLYNDISMSFYAFTDTPKTSTHLGISFPFTFKDFSTDALFSFNPSSFFDFSVLASYSFAYKQFKPDSFYSAATLNIHPSFFPNVIKSLQTTAEYSSDYNFTPEDFFAKTGFILEKQNSKKYFLQFRPYYFISGSNFNTLSQGLGGSLQTYLNLSHFGISENSSIRYVLSPLGKNEYSQTKLLKSDFYRATKPEDPSSLIFSNDVELYFANLDPNLTFAELVIVQQIKTGPFYDICYNSSLNQCTGLFFRTQISLIGLCNFIFDSGCGWDITKGKFFGFFEMKSHM